MLFAGARLHTARVGCAVSVAVFSQNAARVESKCVFLCLYLVCGLRCVVCVCVWCCVCAYPVTRIRNPRTHTADRGTHRHTHTSHDRARAPKKRMPKAKLFQNAKRQRAMYIETRNGASAQLSPSPGLPAASQAQRTAHTVPASRRSRAGRRTACCRYMSNGITEPTVRCVIYIYSFPTTTSRTQEVECRVVWCESELSV